MIHWTRRRGSLHSLWFAVSLMVLATLTAQSESPNSISQEPGRTKDKSASLVGAEASFDQGNLTIVMKAQAEPTQWYRVYLDTDYDGSTGYQHDWRKDEGEGADFLVEGGTLSKWDGGKAQGEWDWEAVSGGSVQTNSEGDNQLTFSIPLSALKVQGGDRIRIFIETMTANYEKTLDIIPRDSPWSVPVPADALDLSVHPN